jgi:hypothetical protein
MFLYLGVLYNLEAFLYLLELEMGGREDEFS